MQLFRGEKSIKVHALSMRLRPRWAGQFLRLFKPSDPLIGLDIGSQTIKLVQLTSKRGKWHLQYCGVRSLPWRGSQEDGENCEMAIVEAIRELVREGCLHQEQVACSMRGPSVMIKTIQVPLMTESELVEHLGWEMDQYIPSNVKDIHWDFHIADGGNLETAEGLMSVLLVAVKKETVQKRVGLIRRSGLNPVVVDVDTIALSNMYAFNYRDSDQKKILLIHVSPSGVDMNVISEGVPVFMREIEVGEERLRNLMEPRGKNLLIEKPVIDVADSSDCSDSVLKAVLRDISKEVKKTIEYCCDVVPSLQIQKLFLGGGYARVPSLAETIEAEVNLPLEFIDPLRKINVPSNFEGRESIQNFDLFGGVAIGLALRGVDIE